MDRNPTALYLYCLARPGCVPEGDGILVRRFSAVCALLSEVFLEDFCGAAAERNLQDLAWIAPRACRHEAVIERAMRDSPVLPARFGTIFSTRASLEHFLDRHGRTISQFLDRVAGQEEWGVKGLLDRSKAPQTLSVEEPLLPAMPPGQRYLQEKKMRAESGRALRCWLEAACRAAADQLRRPASEFSERRVPAESKMGSQQEVILNWAFLVPRSRLAEFQAEVQAAAAAHAGTGLSFEASGPWPPYSFTPALSMEPAG